MLKKFLYWTPKVLAILFIIFISLLGLDVLSEELTFWQSIMAFLIHLTPTYILIITLVIAWKWEHIGGAIFVMLSLFYFIWTEDRSVAATLVISGTLFVIGTLFLLDNAIKERAEAKERPKKEVKIPRKQHIMVINPNAKSQIIKSRVKQRGSWKSTNISQIKMHDTVRLTKKPEIEGEVRLIDAEKKRVEFSHRGKPISAKINEIKVLVKG